MAITTSRSNYDKQFLGDNQFLNNPILECFHEYFLDLQFLTSQIPEK